MFSPVYLWRHNRPSSSVHYYFQYRCYHSGTPRRPRGVGARTKRSLGGARDTCPPHCGVIIGGGDAAICGLFISEIEFGADDGVLIRFIGTNRAFRCSSEAGSVFDVLIYRFIS